MKRILTIIILLVISGPILFSQNKEIKNIFEKYEKNKSVESVYLSPFLMAMAGKFTNDAEGKEWISAIEEMRILTVEMHGKNSGNVELVKQIKGEFDNLFGRYKFERALRVKDGDELVEMYVLKEDKGLILFLNDSPDEFSVIVMFGSISDKILKAVMKGGVKFN
ncbi:MAG: DUF4252 domain-containing protein [Bacteroidales bacterium]|nr:DUF4252 domain-containing protein [Bacteroidales bacterium]MDD2425150.1 DUF4252 domain-containing protein [Bacteroidales bacterium]MDD3989603.1 DUF4252 domain-containing protein [Bacteroidales bacterium]MDD4638840.1 DUF4252 domain-containing protein [Bacteroidales bacterium]